MPRVGRAPQHALGALGPGVSALAPRVFQEWYGIRAAAGYLPGTKLAIAAERPLTSDDRRAALDAIFSASSRAVVVHGWSQNMFEVIQLAKQHNPKLNVFGVWHGSTAQFFSDVEFEAVSHLLEMRKVGVLKGLATVKPGMELLSDRIHPKPLLNIGPHLPEGRPAPRGPLGAALVPVANDYGERTSTPTSTPRPANRGFAGST